MNFEDMQLIWNQQDEKPLYAIDHAAMGRWVKDRSRSLLRSISIDEWIMIATLLIAGSILVWAGIAKSAPGKFVPAAFTVVAAGYILFLRFLRLRESMNFDDSLLGTVDHALSQIDHQVRRIRTMGWWLIAPFLLTASVSFVIEGRSWIAWVLTYAILLGSLWGARREILCKYRPRQEELRALREKLSQAGE